MFVLKYKKNLKEKVEKLLNELIDDEELKEDKS